MRCEITRKNCQKSKNSGKIVKFNNCEEKTNEPHVICKSSAVFCWWEDQKLLPNDCFEGRFKQFTFSEIDSFVKKVRSGAKIKLESAHKYSQFSQIGEGRSTRK